MQCKGVQLNDLALPRPAATVLLLRQGLEGLEVFMVERHHQIDFATGALVFPGGKVDPGDREPEWADLVLPEGLESLERAFRVAAVRETYEESGVLLTQTASGALADYREPVHLGQISFLHLIQENSLKLDLLNMVPFAHWITPELAPKRYDTRFYLAPAPADQLALHDGGESVDSLWITPRQAIEAARSQQRIVIYPTLMNLAKLARYQSVEEALVAAQNFQIIPITPWLEEDGLKIPTEADYPELEPDLIRLAFG